MKRVKSFILRVVRCALHRHYHHCCCHYQKCRCRIHLSLKSSPDPIPFCNVYFATSAENRCGCNACDGCGSGGDSSLHTGICVIGACRFAGFIISSINCCPLNHKGASSPFVFLVHPEVEGT